MTNAVLTKRMKAKPLVTGIAIVILAASQMACTPTTPHWDTKFGDAVRLAVKQQTLNPNAGTNPDPVAGVDGNVAREAMGRYQNSFKEPPPAANVFTIGVGK